MNETKIELNIPEMQKMNIMFATPMYGGMCHGLYTKSLMDTTGTFMNHGISTQIYYLFNEVNICFSSIFINRLCNL